MIHPEPLKNTSLLIIEDVMAPRKMLRRLLNVFGEYKYEEAENIKSAKDKLLSNSNFNIILCDINLPDGSGIELLRWIRFGEAGERFKDIAFVCYSSDLDKEIVKEAKSLGASGILTKPFNIGDIYQVFASTFNWGKETRKYFDQRLGE